MAPDWVTSRNLTGTLELRHAARSLLKTPGTTCVIVAGLGLGIGANTAIFSVVSATLLAPMMTPEAERVVILNEVSPEGAMSGVSYPNFRDLKWQSAAFEGFWAYRTTRFNITGDQLPETISAAFVTGNFADVLGLHPVLGRTFTALEEAGSGSQVAILSDRFWQRRFGGDPHVLGKTIVLDNTGFSVVGVLPPTSRSFKRDGTWDDVWVPLALCANALENRSLRLGLWIYGRRRAQFSIQQVRAELNTVAHRLESAYPESNDGVKFRARPLPEYLIQDARPTVVLLQAIGILVLAIVCTNACILILARVVARRGEVALRAALGGTIFALIAPFVWESFLIASAGMLLGVAVAGAGGRALAALDTDGLLQLKSAGIDMRVFGFALLTCLAVALVCSAVPTLAAWRTNISGALSLVTRGGTSSRRQRRTTGALLAWETALSLILLTSTGLVVNSLIRLENVNPGYRTRGLLSFQTALADPKYSRPAAVADFSEQLTRRLRDLPGVQSTAAATVLPLSGWFSFGRLSIEGRIMGRQRPRVDYLEVGKGYFTTMGIPLLRGREFSETDRLDSPPVAIIDAVMAQQFWRDQDPIGRRMRLELPQWASKWFTIIGVVGHTRHFTLEDDGGPQAYFALAQTPTPLITFVIHSNSAATTLQDQLKKAVLQIDPKQPVFQIRAMEDQLRHAVAPQTLSGKLLGLISLLSLTLVAVGTFGAVRYVVELRTREIGVRLAIGAQKKDILRLILSYGFLVVLLGIVAGGILIFPAKSLFSSLLFGTRLSDLRMFFGGAALLIAIAAIAAYMPARRAMEMDPLTTLRQG